MKNIHSEVLERLRLAYKEEQAFIQNLAVKERAIIGTYEQWSVKDIIAHIASWKERTAQELAAVRYGEPRPEGDSLEQINEKIYKNNFDLTWDEVVAYSKQTYAALCKQVEALSQENLINTKAIKWYNGPVWRLSIDDGFSHPLTHIAEYYEKKGEKKICTRIRKKADKSRRELLESVDGSR